MDDVRLSDMRANERCFFRFSGYNFEQTFARLVRHIAGRKVSRHGVVVVVVTVGSSHQSVVAVIVAFADGRRSYQRLCDGVAEEYDIELPFACVAVFFVAGNTPKRGECHQNYGNENCQNFLHNCPLFSRLHGIRTLVHFIRKNLSCKYQKTHCFIIF